jgi:two-component system phosphate regulon response regulator PhoB
LLVEDEAPVREMLKFALADEDFEILEAADAGEGFTLMQGERPDLILLDWMLPGMSGVEFARRVKKDAANRDIPIIMLTARAEEDDKVKGLQEADDYIIKPFSTRELKARILAVLRRVTPGGQLDLIQVNGLCLDPVGHKVTVQGELLDVGPTEFRLLHFFMAHPERVYTREQLLNNVWGQNVYVEERTVDVHIRRLRKALAVSGHDRHVQTVRTVGYRFSTQV